jgi:transglutaminase-like putative cysteine protease/tetratricopeptide (TPR) repeat protein
LTAADRVRQLRALAQRYPASLDIAFELAPLLISSGSNDDAFRMLRKIVVADGGVGALLRLASFYDDQGDRPEVDRMISQEVKTDPTDVGALNEYGSTLDAKNDIPHAVEADLKVLKLQPDDLGALRALASDYTTAQNTPKAVAAYQQLAIERPQDASVQSSLGDALQRSGRRPEAIACYQLAVQLDPNSASARDRIQVLTGQKPIIDLAPALPTPNLDSLRGKPSGSAPSTVFFVDEKREVVYPDYLTVCEYHEVMKVNDQAAVERYQSYHLDRDSQASTIHVLSARLIKADGKVEDHSDDSSDGGDSDEVDFPSLDTGDIIDIAYRVEDRAKGVLAHQFWSSWYFSGPENEDRHSRFSLITPVGMTYKYVVHGGAPEPTERTSGQWRIRQWDVVNGPAHKEETYGVPVNDWAEWVDVSTIESWRDVVSWYQDLSDPRCQPDETIRAKAAELTRGASTPDDKIAALVRYVSHDIQYQSTPFRLSAYVPTEGKEVVRERYGDCKDKAALLTAMLSTIGIKSRMVLLSPRTYGLTPYLPSPRFAHAIALVDAPGGPLWIDGTADDLGYRHLPIADQGISALVIDSSTQDLQQIPFLPVENRASTTDIHGTIDAAGRFVCDVTVTMTGNYAWSVRSLLRKIPTDKGDEVLRGFASELNGMDYDGGSITCKDDPDAPVIFEVKCHDDQFGTPAGSFMLIDSPWGVKHDSSLLNTLSAPDRTQDLDLAESRVSMAVNIAIDLPAGYVPQDLAPTVAAQSPWGSYSFQYTVDGNQLKESYTGVASAQRVLLADIPKYVAYSRAMEDEFSKKIVLKKS